MEANKNIARFVETLDRLSIEGHDVPGLILSRPGYGKTSTIDLWCKYKNYNFFSLIPSRYGSDDVLGLQTVDGKVLNRLTPSWFNKFCKNAMNGKRNVLFIDELTTCDPYIQGPLLDLIFSHSLGEDKYLPDNTLIIAAGNYSSDLNNMFKMTAPMVNRFEILNLMNNDFDISELLDNTFFNLNTNKDIEEFLEIKPDTTIDYDFNKFKEWVRNSREVQLGQAKITEDDNLGLLGFTSPRSICYTMSFVQNYMKNYSDTLWTRIAGDTLGTSVKREGKPMRDVLMTFEKDFIKNGDDERTIFEVCDDILSCKKIMKTDLVRLENLIKNTPCDEITEADTDKFVNLVKTFSKNKDIIYLSDLMRKKIQSESKYTEI